MDKVDKPLRKVQLYTEEADWLFHHREGSGRSRETIADVVHRLIMKLEGR